MGTVTMKIIPWTSASTCCTPPPRVAPLVDIDALDAVAMDPSTEVILQAKVSACCWVMYGVDTLFPTLRSVAAQRPPLAALAAARAWP